MGNVALEIGDFLLFCDKNGVDALESEQVQNLMDYIEACNSAARNGEHIVEDGVWDRLMEILREVAPESDLARLSWEDTGDEYEDTDRLVQRNPMYSIQTVKSFDCDEIKAFEARLPEDTEFDAHISVKLNGHGIRVKYVNGSYIGARSRARSSAGRDIGKQLGVVLRDSNLEYVEMLADFDLVEIRGEWVLPYYNLDEARRYNSSIVSAFSGVASMGRESASEEEWGLLRFVAYEVVADGLTFETKSDEYAFLEECGFEVPLNWVIEGLSKEDLIQELEATIVPECEEEVAQSEDGSYPYEYYTDGLVFCINDVNFFRRLGDDGGHYKYGNMALKVGYWKQDMYVGYVQTILWTKGKTKLSPVAIVAPEQDVIEFVDGGEHYYVSDIKMISNFDEMGVVTASGNRVRRVPLYEPNNMLALDAYRGGILHFRYGGEAGVIPCFSDGRALVDGKVRQMLQDDYGEEEFEYVM